MKHVIIGTAGHVDHGKTALIRALTGIDTDRLAEEKKRGITIELGFAHLDFDDGTQAGIVDVPGHEKFIKNMLAGAGGIDLAMLIVAADEGFMPQTVEHLDILELLGIQNGLVVITKVDMAERDWIDMVREDIAERVKGTFLEGKPIYEVSALRGDGIAELRAALQELVKSAAEKDMNVPFRLPVDRVFSVDGFGTVVTGTLIEGCMKVGDSAQIAPEMTEAKIRNLQVHGQDVSAAYAGQRVAVNLTGMKKAALDRGCAIIKPGSEKASLMLDVRLRNLKDSGRMILNNSQVHLFHGSRVVLAKVVLLDRDVLEPGESCYAQLRMTETVATRIGDRFVIRFYSPMETIGGGVILDDAPMKHKRNIPAILESLRIRESGSGRDKLLHLVQESRFALPDCRALAAKAALDEGKVAEELQELLAEGAVREALPGRYIARETLDQAWATARALLTEFHQANPLLPGMKGSELRQKLYRGADAKTADAVLHLLAEEGKLRRVGECVALSEFEIAMTPRQREIAEELRRIYRESGMEPPNTDDVLARFSAAEQAEVQRVLASLISDGELRQISEQILYDGEVFRDICRKTAAHFESHDTLTLAELRDLLGSSRKYTQALLETFDKLRYTRNENNVRRLYLGFDREGG
ncbi:MAG: selenocysteine-specific translation elongation factor [Oscillospiraceae bacterium]